MDRSYGDALRIARERQGADIVSMSRKLHIRPDILKAIENADFSKMPSRGYSRNMIRAYARQVGLDEREISERYLDEVQLYESGMPRTSSSSRTSRGGSFHEDRYRYSAPRRNRLDDRDGVDGYRPPRRSTQSINGDLPRSERFDRRQSQAISRSNSARSSFDNDLYAQGSYSNQTRNYSRNAGDRRDAISNRRGSYGRTERIDSSDRSIRFKSYPESNGKPSGSARRQMVEPRRLSRPLESLSAPIGQERRNRNRQVTIGDSSYSYNDMYSSNKGQSRELNMPIIILIAIIAIAVIIVVAVMLNSSTNSVEEIPDIPISGFTDTSEPEPEVTTPVVTSAEPTKAVLTYSLESGSRSWIEVTENGSSKPLVSGVQTGPQTDTFDVTGTLTFSTANPTPVTVTVDGEEVKLQKSSKTDYYTYTVDFPAILAAWRAENETPPENTAATRNTSAAKNTNTANTKSTTNANSTSSNSNTRASNTRT